MMKILILADRLGKSGLKISKVILGAMSYGDPGWQGWVLDEEKSLPLLEHAYKVGLNTWDTVSFLFLSAKCNDGKEDGRLKSI